MGIANIPCADCHYCYPIGEGQGLCDYGEKEVVVELFECNTNCPHHKAQKESPNESN